MARDAGVSVDTARRYMEYLRVSYQTILLQPYHRNITSSVVKTPKLYWVDVGLLRQLCGFQGEPTGEMYETYVVSELVKWMKTVQRAGELYFYRTRSDAVFKCHRLLVALRCPKNQAVLPTMQHMMLLTYVYFWNIHIHGHH
jgi:predicted AAA+ superfamily ATPase